ncbi:NAD(P)/FAD-dependent oxidoreductase [Cellulomonas composti]|uniref:NAD(FAD)-utilizing dehydrogenase n=1 Tax=Cellulomonas composti TaxID=266130 RepID=A0A511J6R5_9CELL|nr:TIGR03862 family flavoprotein [Cellulomonas composti]GEL93685.1 NAD(FAD)-utilizing dehydrogenase [Cellulomonas composti]
MSRAGTGRSAIVVGAGPAGLIAAETLARAGVSVTVLDRMPSPGRKFLLAGHGGLNLTHSEPRERFLSRYGPSADRLAPMLDVFGPDDLRAWCTGLGEATFVGTSGRVFPQAFRANPLFRAWLRRLDELGVTLRTRQRWVGWSDDGALRFMDAAGDEHEVRADATVLALGGASWPRLGSDGTWAATLDARGVAVTRLRAANVGVRVDWTARHAERFAGVPLKSVALSVAGEPGSVRGDAMVTATGLEGGPVYALGVPIRSALDAGRCVLHVDLRPDLGADEVARRLAVRRPRDSGSSWLRRTLGLDPVAISLVREAGGGALPDDPTTTAELVRAVPVVVTATMPIDRAISTAGGVAWDEVDASLMLRRLPGTFVAGEMIDWEAPTGGYLLQASFATGVVAARGVLAWLGVSPPSSSEGRS